MKAKGIRETDFDVKYERCCGLDIHKDVIAACVLANGEAVVETFGTMTDDLLQLSDWLKTFPVEMVAMESTGSYWKPIFNVLELEEVPAILVNAQHVKNTPGRKTDMKDSEWLAKLLKHGLLKPSFVPNRESRELRELVRYSISLTQERTRFFQRIDKILQGANIKLSSVASTLNTKSAREMIVAMIRGEVDEETLAVIAKGRMKAKIPQLKRAMNGLLEGHQRFMLGSLYSQVESLDRAIAAVDARITECMESEEDLIERLTKIPGVGRESAKTIIAEIGTDMSQFPSAESLSAWAGMCPGNNESAGKKKGENP